MTTRLPGTWKPMVGADLIPSLTALESGTARDGALRNHRNWSGSRGGVAVRLGDFGDVAVDSVVLSRPVADHDRRARLELLGCAHRRADRRIGSGPRIRRRVRVCIPR